MNKNTSDDGEKLAFLNGLQQFLNDKGKILFPYPILAGKTIDLHDLYNRVTTLGGYQKVTDKDLWDEFLLEYKFPVISSSLAFGLKTIYQRYLEEYERVHFFGDDEVPKKYRLDISIRRSRNPHFISEHDRVQYGLSATRLSEPRFNADISDYERIAFSLTSGLPNEVDFAINACTLLSGESRHVLRLSRCPQLLDALLLHAGIVSSGVNTFGEIGNTWNDKTGHNFFKFWAETVSDTLILEQMLPQENQRICTEKSYCGSNSKTRTVCKNCNKEISTSDKELTNNISAETSKCSYRKWCYSKKDNWTSIFQSKRHLGVQDYEGQRVLQIALVLLNLSFESFNVPILANNKSLVQFVFLCVHSNYSSLRQTGLDILGNVSASMDIEKLGLHIMQCTYTTVERCIQSHDKFDNIRGFEVLGNLCKSQANKDSLLISVGDDIFKSSVLLLTIGDIELALAAIEALYTLSKLGEETCTKIAIVSGSIDILVCLITFNVRTLGASQLSAIRIARKIAPPQPPHIHRIPPQPTATNYTAGRVIHPQQIRPIHHAVPTRYPTIRPNPAETFPSNQTPVSQMSLSANISLPKQGHPKKTANRPIGAGPTYTHTETSSVPPVFHYMPAPPPDIALDKSPESFAQLWVWATYEQCGNDDGSVPRVQLFSDYATVATRYGMSGKNQVLPAAEFGRCLQRVFSNTASRLFNDCNGQPMYHITGIKKRQTPLPVPGYHPQVSANVSMNSTESNIPPQGQANFNTTCNLSSASTVAPSSCGTPRLTQQVASTSTSAKPTDSINIKSPSTPKPNNTKTSVTTTTVCKDLETSRTGHEYQNGLDHIAHGSPAPVNNHSNSTDLHDGHLPIVNRERIESFSTKRTNGTVEVQQKLILTHALTSKDKTSTDACQTHCDDSHIKTDKRSQINCKAIKEAINHNDDEDDNINCQKSNDLKSEVVCNGYPDKNLDCLTGVLPDTKTSDKETTTTTTTTTHAMNGCLSPPHIDSCNRETKANNVTLTKTPSVGYSPESSKPVEDPVEKDSKKVVDVSHDEPLSLSPNVQHKLTAQTHQAEEIKPMEAVISTSVGNLPHEQNNVQHSPPSITNHSVSKSLPLGGVTETLAPRSDITQVCGKREHDKTDEVPESKRMKIETTSTQPPSKPIYTATSYQSTQTNLPLTTTTTVTHPVRFPAPKPSTAPHAPSGATAHPGQKKPPPIDLMAPNASLMVLFRNSGKQAFDDFSDDKEDPISKSIRLTAALILTNIAKCCDLGRSLLQRHEPWFAQLAMSGMDCSPNLAKLLAEMNR